MSSPQWGGAGRLGESTVQRVNGAYLYEVGYQIHPLVELEAGVSEWARLHIAAIVAEGALEPLIGRSVFQLQTVVQPGNVLLSLLREAKERSVETSGEDYNKAADAYLIVRIQTALTLSKQGLSRHKFSLLPLYVVSRRAALSFPN